jgi:hypothetical protein
MDDLQAQYLGKLPSLKAVSGVRNIYESRVHVKRREVGNAHSSVRGADQHLQHTPSLRTEHTCGTRKTKKETSPSKRSDTFRQGKVVNTRQRLGQKLSEHIGGGDLVEHDSTFPNQLPRIMVLYVDILRPIMEHWVLRKSDTPLIVRPQDFAQRLLDPSKIGHPHRFLRHLAERHIFHLRRRQSDTRLFLRFLANHAVSDFDEMISSN